MTRNAQLGVALIVLLAALILCPCAPAGEENKPPAATPEKPAIPPGLTTYKGRKIAVTMHYKGAPWLVRESREREEECSTLLKVLNLKPGQVVCDMGSGNGFYALKLALQRIVPEYKPFLESRKKEPVNSTVRRRLEPVVMH